MKELLMLLILASCSQIKVKNPEPEEDLVSLDAALSHAKASYLKGCIDAHHTLGIPKSFEGCRDKAELHRQEIEAIVNQVPVELRSTH